MSEQAVIKVTRALGKVVRGEALVSKEGFSPRYDLDRTTGLISKIGHSLEGQSIRDKIMIIPSAKGGVAAGWAFADIAEKGFALKALVFGKLNPVMVQGAVFAGMTITEGWDPDASTTIRTGDLIEVDPAAREIRILKRAEPGQV
jgi:predicted aconitase with swiveling domain